MSVAGIFLKGNNANIVTLDGTRREHNYIAEALDVLELEKNPTQENVATVVRTLRDHIEKNGVTQIVLNRRVTAGQMAGAAGTFLWEGILLAVCPVPLTFVHVATVRATNKKDGALKTKQPPEEQVGRSKAYDFAFEGLA